MWYAYRLAWLAFYSPEIYQKHLLSKLHHENQNHMNPSLLWLKTLRSFHQFLLPTYTTGKDPTTLNIKILILSISYNWFTEYLYFRRLKRAGDRKLVHGKHTYPLLSPKTQDETHIYSCIYSYRSIYKMILLHFTTVNLLLGIASCVFCIALG